MGLKEYSEAVTDRFHQISNPRAWEYEQDRKREDEELRRKEERRDQDLKAVMTAVHFMSQYPTQKEGLQALHQNEAIFMPFLRAMENPSTAKVAQHLIPTIRDINNMSLEKQKTGLANIDRGVALRKQAGDPMATITGEEITRQNLTPDILSRHFGGIPQNFGPLPTRKKTYGIATGAEQPSESVGTAMKDFELTMYGKKVPELRGKKEYRDARLNWIRQQKEQSPWVDALERQIEVTARREGSSLRKEFNDLPEVKEAAEIRRKYEVMQTAFNESKTTNNFVAVDQAIITLFNKMTDPESVVRESEYARTQSDLSMWRRLRAKIEKLEKGGAGLTQEDREAIFKMASKFQEVAQKKYNLRLHEYRGYITSYGLDPDKYLTPYGETETIEGTLNQTTDLSKMSDDELMRELYK